MKARFKTPELTTLLGVREDPDTGAARLAGTWRGSGSEREGERRREKESRTGQETHGKLTVCSATITRDS